MTELELRKQVVSVMESWVGLNEKDGSFKPIIDLYNSYTPRPRGVKLSYSSPWCAATVSAAFIKTKLVSIAPVECSCSKMIELYKRLDCWEEDESITPQVGDLCMYDWDDNGVGNNKGAPDHVGMVSEVGSDYFVVIEGNKNEAVGKRTLKINGKYIRGFCCPDYGNLADDTDFPMVAAQVPVLKKGVKGDPVGVLQTLLLFYGYDPKGIDNSFGPGCEKALKSFQKDNDLAQDGSCGPATWSKLIGG